MKLTDDVLGRYSVLELRSVIGLAKRDPTQLVSAIASEWSSPLLLAVRMSSLVHCSYGIMSAETFCILFSDIIYTTSSIGKSL